jgi:signal peptidase I, archaeal type
VSDSFNFDSQPTTNPKLKRKRIANKVGNILFWIAFTFAFICVIVFASSGKGSRNILGYFFFEVLTTSMQSEIPQGSLVLVHEVKAEDIKKGDDITFLVDDKGTTFTHRVIRVIDNYDERGQVRFQTQGIENPLPDSEIVVADNIIGKVVWHLPFFGQSLTWVKTNWWICASVIVGIALSAVALKILLKKDKRTKTFSFQKEEIS